MSRSVHYLKEYSHELQFKFYIHSKQIVESTYEIPCISLSSRRLSSSPSSPLKQPHLPFSQSLQQQQAQPLSAQTKRFSKHVSLARKQLQLAAQQQTTNVSARNGLTSSRKSPLSSPIPTTSPKLTSIQVLRQLPQRLALFLRPLNQKQLLHRRICLRLHNHNAHLKRRLIDSHCCCDDGCGYRFRSYNLERCSSSRELHGLWCELDWQEWRG